MDSDQNSDLLQGYAEIGGHLRMTENAAKHRVKSEGIPVFHMGRIVCARRATLNAWLAAREAAALQPRSGDAVGGRDGA